ncbi:hypothetical protein V8E36_003466 [Tilletia maclaganii]
MRLPRTSSTSRRFKMSRPVAGAALHEAGGEETQRWSSAFRVFVADADGHLKVLRTLPHQPAPPAIKTAKPSDHGEGGGASPTQDGDGDAAEADKEEHEEEKPQLPCLQLLHIEGRPKIASPSYSNTSVNASPDAVQKMVGGRLASGHWVLAIARRDASIDVVVPLPQPRWDGDAEGDDTYQPQRAILVHTVTEDNMRVGMERWVGLSIGASGIYSCTSAGALRFTPIVCQSPAGGRTTGRTALSLGNSSTIKLPNAPLTQVIFTSFSSSKEDTAAEAFPQQDPTHFLCGGHEVPLSIWHLQSAFASSAAQGPLAEAARAAAGPSTTLGGAAAREDDGAEEEAIDLSTLSAKQRKRKRQVEARNKTRELREGEIWRAKALPNDALSLQQKPNISAIAILSSGSTDPNASAPSSLLLPAGLEIGTATRNGMLRIYRPDPGSHGGKALAEFACLGGKGAEGKKKEAQGVKGTMAVGLIKKGVSIGGTEVKLVHVGADGSEVFVADTQGKLYALDVNTQRVLYQYPNIEGSVTSLTTVLGPGSAGPRSSSPSAYLLSTSLDRILRLHSTSLLDDHTSTKPLHGKANVKASSSRRRGNVLVQKFAGDLYGVDAEMEGTLPAAPTAAVWDSVVPAPLSVRGDEEEGGGVGERMDVEGEDRDEEDDVWDEMGQVGGGGGGGADEEEEEDEGKAGSARKGGATKKKRGA